MSDRPLRTPSMADVAAVAGVSAQTVSRVLSRHPHVTEATRMLVERAIDEIGYRRTGIARALVTGRTRTVGVLTQQSYHHAGAAMMLGIQRAARDLGYFVSSTGTASVSAEAVTDGIEHLRDQGVDALVIALPVWDEEALRRATRGVPTAVIDAVSSSADHVVLVDQRAAGRTATEHLLGLGHDTVWHVAGPASWKDAAGRTTGWSDALVAAGRPVPPAIHGDWTAESGYRAGLELARMPEVDAVFVASDEMAFGVLAGLRELGRRVPEEVAVVGMDDIPLARYAVPPLTTVRQPFEEMGETAVRRVLEIVDDTAGAQATTVLQPELVVRASSSPPARG